MRALHLPNAPDCPHSTEASDGKTAASFAISCHRITQIIILIVISGDVYRCFCEKGHRSLADNFPMLGKSPVGPL